MIKQVHLSIDDVGNSLKWITYNLPKSIFDTRLFGQLKAWHNAYGCKFTLYCFAMLSDYLISEIPLKYEEELRTNNEWLKFGFHGKRGDIKFCEEDGYVAGYELVSSTLMSLGMVPSQVIRLHYWIARGEQKEYLYKQGIRTLLYPDDESFGYGLDDSFIEHGLNHWRTRVRFEQIEEINEATIGIGLNRVVAFTHEKCFDEQKDKIERAIKLYCKNGYVFIN